MNTIAIQANFMRYTHGKLARENRRLRLMAEDLADQIGIRQAQADLRQTEQAAAGPSMPQRINYAKAARKRVEYARSAGVKLDYSAALAEAQGVPRETLVSRIAAADSEFGVRCAIARLARERVLTARAAGHPLEFSKALAAIEQEARDSLAE